MTIIMLVAIALIFQRVKGLVLDLPACPPRAHQTINFVHLLKSGDKKATAVSLKIKLDLSYEDDATKEPAISIMANFVADYSIAENFQDEKTFQQFQQRVGMANLWPYWREFVQSMTTRMGLPALPIPLLNVTELKPDDEQSKD